MDPFALLGLQCRPLLSDEEIGTAYRKLAGKLHPDQPGGNGSRFKELGEAAEILRDPARRLRSLMGGVSASALPAETADLFARVATLLQQADELFVRHASVTNPLAKAVLVGPLRTLATDLDTLLAAIGNWQANLEARMVTLDSEWPHVDPKQIAPLADSFSYAKRWESQLRERKLALMCL